MPSLINKERQTDTDLRNLGEDVAVESLLKREQEEDIKRSEKMIFKVLVWTLSIGGIGLVGYSVATQNMISRLVYVSLLLAAANFVSGFFLGNLFGLPKRNSDGEISKYTLNNSLVEISEWLTKIIVGLGLVNLLKIPSYLKRLAEFVSSSSGIEGKSLDVFCICVVIYFGVLGLYIGYNYMRLVLSPKYKIADDNLLKKEKELKTLVFKQEVANKKILEELNDVTLRTNSSDVTVLQEDIISKAEKKLLNGQKNNKLDPQKGQWGGNAEANERVLTATVIEKAEGLYEITLKVTSTNPQNPIPDGETVLFALHDSYGPKPFRVITVTGGSAVLSLYSYGSFTVGAFVDNGQTELELDLADLPGVSQYFKEH